MNKPVSSDIVTDHALVRYLDRSLDIDVEAVRKQIAEETAPAIATGAVAMHKEGLRYIFKGGKVVTVLLSRNEMQRYKELRTGGSHD